MSIYLYIKTHNVTGLKYLGKTSSKNPHTYTGSGIYWKDHLRVHGYDYTTEIVHICESNDEIKKLGEYYSDLWDIVNARDAAGKKTWANLKPESGDGGITDDIINKIKLTKKLNGTEGSNPDIIQKMLATRIRNGTNCNTPESIAAGIATKELNGTLKMSAESRQKISRSKRGQPGRKFTQENRENHSASLIGHVKTNVLVSRLFDRKIMHLCQFTRWCNQSYSRPKIGSYKKVVCRLSDRKEMTLGKFHQWESSFASC